MRLPTRLRRPLGLLAGATLAAGVLSTAAPATAATLPSQPVVTPSTAGPVTVGTPMTVTIAPGASSDHVYGYAWTWQSPSNAPTYTALPTCGSNDATGGIHFICGSSVTVQVSPESGGFPPFTVWAFDAAGNRSAASSIQIAALEPYEALFPVSHQWTTDAYGGLPAMTGCTDETGAVTCVPDSNVPDAARPSGADPLRLPAGVTWAPTGSWYFGLPSGELAFDGTHAATASGAVVDPSRSFTVGAWATPDGPGTVVAGHAPGGTGYALRLNSQMQWEFDLASTPGQVVRAVSTATASSGTAVYVTGVYDAVNRELRLYVNGLAAVAGVELHRSSASKGVVLVGESWTGRIGNPVLVQAALSSYNISQLSDEGFFPNPNGDLN